MQNSNLKPQTSKKLQEANFKYLNFGFCGLNFNLERNL